MYLSHGGSTASIYVGNATVYYEAYSLKYEHKCLYKNYLGQEYKERKAAVKSGDFKLSEEDFERILDEIVIEKVESMVEGEIEYEDEW